MLDQTTPISPGAEIVQDSAASYLPEPSSTGVGLFHDVLDVARTAVGEVGGVSLEATGSFAELIQAQIQAQMEMQTTSLISNLERSKHESKMAAIRNIRLS